MSFRLRILSAANGRPTSYDGQYVKDYDPGRDGEDSTGQPMFAYLEGTDDPEAARAFETVEEAAAFWKMVDPRQPQRPDGEPNRPLTFFTVEIKAGP